MATRRSKSECGSAFWVARRSGRRPGSGRSHLQLLRFAIRFCSAKSTSHHTNRVSFFVVSEFLLSSAYKQELHVQYSRPKLRGSARSTSFIQSLTFTATYRNTSAFACKATHVLFVTRAWDVTGISTDVLYLWNRAVVPAQLTQIVWSHVHVVHVSSTAS